MVYLMGMQPEGYRARRRSSVDELFDAGAWKIRSIWDGVKLEIACPEENPVVLNSFTHLDPDLPILEVRRRMPFENTVDSLGVVVLSEKYITNNLYRYVF